MRGTIARRPLWRYTTAMPELPEVETVVRGLARRLEGRRLAALELRRSDLRRAVPAGMAGLVEGRRIERLGRRAKYILMHLEDGGVVIAHLGMSGRLVIAGAAEAAEMPDPHDHVVFRLDDGTVVRFNDARRFGLLDYARAETIDEHPLLAHLGPEPLGNAFNGPVLEAALAGKATPLKAALLDQRVVAGLGNIYVSESLYWAGLSPRRLAATVVGGRAERLAQAIRSVLERAIAAGGSSLRDYVQTSGELGYFQHQWAVYGKAGEPCPDCDCRRGIQRIVQGGRSTFYCPKRQR
jgi:formamidopyrimidine-DNA glycosylase